MHITWPIRRKLDTLIWEYLDGESTPDRLTLLERLLMRKRSARQKFVEYSRLHTMLCDFFRSEQSDSETESRDEAVTDGDEVQTRRKRHRKSGAA